MDTISSEAAISSGLKRWLKAAAIYNLLWGAVVVLFPHLIFDLVGATRPNYPEIWQCVGMIVGVYGIGYWVAARDPIRHWPIVLVGLLGKIFGPIGFIQAVFISKTFPIGFGWTILTNDLIWWIPFALILKKAFEWHSQIHISPAASTPRLEDLLRRENLLELSFQKPLLLVLLRHKGCTFCRETLDSLSKASRVKLGQEIQVVFVHMSDGVAGKEFISSYGFQNFIAISDRQLEWYRALALPRATWSQAFGPKIWWHGLRALIAKRIGVGALDGDGFQLSGAFLIRSGKIDRSHRSVDVADRPEWDHFL